MPKKSTTRQRLSIRDADFRWYRISLLLAASTPEKRRLHPLFVLRALFKSVRLRNQAPPLAFHVPDCVFHDLKAWTASTSPFPVNLLLFTSDEAVANEWLNAFVAYLAEVPGVNHSMAVAPSVEARRFTPLEADLEASAVELEFLTPLPFRPNQGTPMTALSIEGFFKGLHARAEALFSARLELPRTEGVVLQNEYWKYERRQAPSRSQPGHSEWLHGCVGPLWFRGNLGPALPWLRLAANIHAGGKQQINPMGYCRLHLAPRPHLDSLLERPSTYRRSLKGLLERSPDAQCVLLPAGTETHGDDRCEPECHSLARALAAGSWTPNPAHSFQIPKRLGVRQVERLEPETQWVHATLHQVLQVPFDRHFSPASVGFRPGKSVQQAITMIQDFIDTGYRHIVRTDIHDCFPSIDLDRLEALLDDVLPPADTRMRNVLHLCLRAPLERGGLIAPRVRGLAQGSPISPLLANLYLHEFDRVFATTPGRLVRYADDIVLLAQTRDAAKDLLGLAQTTAATLGLRLSEEKTKFTEASRGFVFLGRRIGGNAEHSDAAQDEAVLRPPLRKTLFVTEPGLLLRNNGAALEVRKYDEPAKVIPIRRLSSVTILAPASLTVGMIASCARAGVPIEIAPGGRHLAMVHPASRGFLETVSRQTAHWESIGSTGRLLIARRIAEAKVGSYRHLLRQRYTAGMNQLLAFLDQQIDRLALAGDVSAVRGHEGAVARRIQRAIDQLIRAPDFHFARRGRREPDRMNPLFNFGYHLVFGRLSALLRNAGLSPWLGYLHDAGDAYESLTCDLQELFRAPVDRMLLSLVNRRELRREHYQEGKTGRLTADGVRIVVSAFDNMLHKQVRGATPAQAMEAQVESLRRHVLGRGSLWVYHWGSQGKGEERGAVRENSY